MVLVDTSVWVRYLQPDSSLKSACSKAIQAFQDAGEPICVCAQVMIEFWAVATRPLDANGLGMSPSDVDGVIEELLHLCVMPDEPADIADRWRKLARRYGPIGKPCHDLRLVALAMAHGVKTVLALNSSDFERYSEIEVNSPLS